MNHFDAGVLASMNPEEASRALETFLPSRLPGRIRSEVDYYGASRVIAKRIGLEEAPATKWSDVMWQHGAVTPPLWGLGELDPPLTEGELSYPLHGTKVGAVRLVSQKRMESFLESLGSVRQVAVGVPYCYVAPSGAQRMEGSLLGMPGHSFVGGDSNYDPVLTEAYADFLVGLRGTYRFVCVCLYSYDYRNDRIRKIYSDRGLPVVSGSDIEDMNCLERMRRLFEMFDCMTSNDIGSHVFYASATGCRVFLSEHSLFGERRAIWEKHPFYESRPNVLSNVLRWLDPAHLREQWPWLYGGPENPVANRAWAEEFLGTENVRDPLEIARLFGWRYPFGESEDGGRFRRYAPSLGWEPADAEEEKKPAPAPRADAAAKRSEERGREGAKRSANVAKAGRNAAMKPIRKRRTLLAKVVSKVRRLLWRSGIGRRFAPKVLHSLARSLHRFGRHSLAWRILSELKRRPSVPQGVDLLRARIALRHGGGAGEAYQCALEELRSFPDNAAALALRDRLRPKVFPGALLGDAEFQKLYEKVFDYTMMSQERLFSLYMLAKRCVEDGIPGDFVECGVARGGGTAVLAYVASLDPSFDRKVYACDTFEGMPEPEAVDTSKGVRASDTGWGAGTCRGGEGSVREICGLLGVADRVVPVRGKFEETLEGLAKELDGIALLHADGDWYSSTRAIFDRLYGKIPDGGPVQIDDYGHWEGCAKAIHEFEAERSERFVLHRIDSTGRWFWKRNAPYSALAKALGLRCNLGCGRSFHRDWLNFDCAPVDPMVAAVDLASGELPLAEDSVELFYSSHVLEHLSREDGKSFVSMLFRYLRPGGGVRLAVPDLEGIARSYLACVEAARNPSSDVAAHDRHEWSVIEMIDQMVRERPGGEMLRFWYERPVRAKEFILERLGDEPREALDLERPPSLPSSSLASPKAYFNFRQGGEIHKWMYDEVSLSSLLEEAGFECVRRVRHDESTFPGFEWRALDASRIEEGLARKPDSLFIEARKPS